MKNIILIISLIAISFACKKKSPEPEVVYQDKIVNTVTHDTVWGPSGTYTITIHDTVYVNVTPTPLNGIWYCYKMESGSTSTLHNDWIFTFGNTIFTQNLSTSGTYNYPITYYSGSVDILFSGSTPTTYYITSMNNGTEYKLTKTNGTVQSWYLRK
jgi:hypothetical protein